MKEDIDKLFAYKEENRICSEEFLYMLSSSCIVYGYIKEARSLIKELKNSSTAGKKIAKLLEIEIAQYDNYLNIIKRNHVSATVRTRLQTHDFFL